MQTFDGSKPNSILRTIHSKVRKPLPTTAVEILKAWLFSPEHVAYPYPNQEEQKQLMKATGLTSKQLKNWFTNARRRIWKKHNETYNISGVGKIRKKRKAHPELIVKEKNQFDLASIFGNDDANIKQIQQPKNLNLKQISENEIQGFLSCLLFEDPVVHSEVQSQSPQTNLFKSTGCFDDVALEPNVPVCSQVLPNGNHLNGFIIDQTPCHTQAPAFPTKKGSSVRELLSKSNPSPENADTFADLIFHSNQDLKQYGASNNLQLKGSVCYICNTGGIDTRIQDCGHEYHGSCLRFATFVFSSEERICCPQCFRPISNCETL